MAYELYFNNKKKNPDNEVVLGCAITNFIFSKFSVMWLTNFQNEKEKKSDLGVNRISSISDSHIINYQICFQLKLNKGSLLDRK